MKASILKPVFWNPEGYKGPAGFNATGGYPADHGFGHEEWNNHPDWIWRGYRVFHTEAKDSLLEFSKTGELGMLMYASHGGRQYAVGIAAGVYDNTEPEIALLADELKIFENWRQLWEVESVRRCHDGTMSSFKRWWRGEHRWVRWKVDPAQYHWFDRPFVLHPKSLTGGDRLTPRYGSFQPLRPKKLLSAIRSKIPEDKSGILDWFEDDCFDERFQAGKACLKRSGSGTRGGKGGSAGNAPTAQDVRYWVFGERIAEPLHHMLQAEFAKHLRRQGFDPVENESYVDVRYHDAGTPVLVEVKPTEKVPAKFAVRAAIGQLMEYRHRLDPTARLEIVISSKPEPESVALLRTLDIRLWHRTVRGFVRTA